ncbi:MAG: DoxX family protein [Nitrospira sp.]|nr:DoxX family protein [Gammaproteobacteria bacterium]MDH5262797.1 DoxX family protein [Gammaproteobacteria bacterium]MDH5626636.1 DoxX family protein [Nitrospira sp.]
MFDRFLYYADAPARAAMAAIFILSGISKIGAFEGTQAYMEAFGVPGVLLGPTVAFEILAGLAVLLGLAARQAAFLLAGFSIITALIFHRDFGDQVQQIMFLKNVAMAGGLLLLARDGSASLSLKQAVSGRKKAAQ